MGQGRNHGGGRLAFGTTDKCLNGRLVLTDGLFSFQHGDDDSVDPMHELAIVPMASVHPLCEGKETWEVLVRASGSSGVGTVVSKGFLGGGSAGCDVLSGGMAFDLGEPHSIRSASVKGRPKIVPRDLRLFACPMACHMGCDASTRQCGSIFPNAGQQL